MRSDSFFLVSQCWAQPKEWVQTHFFMFLSEVTDERKSTGFHRLKVWRMSRYTKQSHFPINRGTYTQLKSHLFRSMWSEDQKVPRNEIRLISHVPWLVGPTQEMSSDSFVDVSPCWDQPEITDERKSTGFHKLKVWKMTKFVYFWNRYCEWGVRYLKNLVISSSTIIYSYQFASKCRERGFPVICRKVQCQKPYR